MDVRHSEFCGLVVAVLRRFLVQNGRTLPPAELTGLAERLAAVVAERGLPRPLGEGEAVGAGGLSEAEVTAWSGRIAGTTAEALLVEAARQLVKACFYPERRTCRDSFREVGRDGVCRRQQAERVRGRLSGAHCVDCPHWVALSPDSHRAMLAQAWQGPVAEFEANEALFLPGDFGALRRWLHAAARGSAADGGLCPEANR